MNDLNKVIITGRLTREPELKQTSSGVSFVTECIAVRGQHKDGEEQTYFFDITAFKGTAESICRICGKGDKITIVGSLDQSKYKNKNGDEKTSIKIIVGEYWLMSHPGTTEQPQQADVPSKAEPVFEEVNGEELPF